MWQSLLVYNACPQPQTEATVLVSPSLLQIDTFGKWCRCLHNVCYVKLKKRRYLDKCRLSAPAGISDAVLYVMKVVFYKRVHILFISIIFEAKTVILPFFISLTIGC